MMLGLLKILVVCVLYVWEKYEWIPNKQLTLQKLIMK